jgi:uncharacterized protein
MPGLPWLVLAAALAGLVRGFSGFGSGLVYMPVAGAVLPPAQAVAVLVVMDMIGPLANMPGALRTGSPREIGWLALGCWGLPLGRCGAVLAAAEVFRWGVSLMALARWRRWCQAGGGAAGAGRG